MLDEHPYVRLAMVMAMMYIVISRAAVSRAGGRVGESIVRRRAGA
jgi:hypothetical protein